MAFLEGDNLLAFHYLSASEIWSDKRTFGEMGLIWEGLLHLKSVLKFGTLVRWDLYERDYCIWNLVWKEDLWWDGTYMRGITASEIWSEKRVAYGERGLIWEGLLYVCDNFMSLELDKSCILVYSYLMHMRAIDQNILPKVSETSQRPRAIEHLGVSETEGNIFWSNALNNCFITFLNY